jgi:hypothetical protein
MPVPCVVAHWLRLCAASFATPGWIVGSIERGLTESLSIEQASILVAAVGLELSVRVYPAGEPLRDRAHASLIGRFRASLHPSLRLLTEVPFPAPGDRRAWDIVVTGAGWRHGVEAETRPRDRQALERRLALKLRDGDVDSMSLLLLDSRHNRDFIRAGHDAFGERFPLPGRRAMELLHAGVDPAGNAIILLQACPRSAPGPAVVSDATNVAGGATAGSIGAAGRLALGRARCVKRTQGRSSPPSVPIRA